MKGTFYLTNTKRVLSLLLISTLIFALCGCSAFDYLIYGEDASEVKKDRVVEQAKEYLAENYPDDEFTYVSGRSPDASYGNYYELGFTTQQYDNSDVTVFGFPSSSDDSYCFYDNYYQYSMQEEAEQYFYDIVDEYVDGSFKIKVDFSTTAGYAMKTEKDKTFAENFDNDSIGFFLCIFTQGNVDKHKKEMIKILDEFRKADKKLRIKHIVVSSLENIENQETYDVLYGDSFIETKMYLTSRDY